eukprot:TRINITY_DN9084_c0_g1_i2.p1 TRINITY_DN9084_c0_g1~~TRINITY_DN9084_c0_g1_i2.p1  ORF type:complete len:864 (-),score=127.11 TRINITY_DN9084_c0_g1_i2:132-2723(-)
MRVMIGSLRWSLDNISYLIQCIQALNTLSASEQSATALIKYDIMTIIMRILRMYPDEPVLFALSFQFLICLIRVEGNALLFEKENGFGFITDVMNRFKDNNTVLKSCIILLKLVCKREKVLSQFHQSESMKPVISMMDSLMVRFENDLDSLRLCCSALHTIFRADTVYVNDEGFRSYLNIEDSDGTEEDDITGISFPEFEALSSFDVPAQELLPRSVRMVVSHFSTQLITNTPTEEEPLYLREKGIVAETMRGDVKRLMSPEGLISKLVYDATLEGGVLSSLSADFSKGLIPTLKFESRFESGNLLRVVQVYDCEYDLVLQPDINTRGHTQWFFFSVENTRKDKTYQFNIINLEKPNSQFNYGMMPVIYSSKRAAEEQIGWYRSGFDICYHPNRYLKEKKGKTFNCYSLTMKLQFPHDDDTCYIAYHYPYTYSNLQKFLLSIETNPSTSAFYRRQVLCRTLGRNYCDLLTITSMSAREDEIRRRKVIVVTGRVHPGESNSSYMMQGFISFLTSNHAIAKELRETFVFKIVPMLNPDGVINGNHRCSLSGHDLNRQWTNPSKQLHPTIYSTKLLIKRLRQDKRDCYMFFDLHGHSRKKYVFMYGCNNDKSEKMKHAERVIPWLLSKRTPMFSMKECDFAIQEAKSSTGRIAVWRDFSIICSYTIESTYCGSMYQHFNIENLVNMGRHLAEAIYDYNRLTDTRYQETIADIRSWMTMQKTGAAMMSINPFSTTSTAGSTSNPPESARGAKNESEANSDDDDNNEDETTMEQRLLALAMGGTNSETVSPAPVRSGRRTSTDRGQTSQGRRPSSTSALPRPSVSQPAPSSTSKSQAANTTKEKKHKKKGKKKGSTQGPSSSSTTSKP